MSRIFGFLLIAIAFVSSFVMGHNAGVNILMDSQFKQGITVLNAYPVLFPIALGIYFIGFILIVFGERLTDPLKRKMKRRKIEKNSKNRSSF